MRLCVCWTETRCRRCRLVFLLPPEKLGNRLCCFPRVYSHMAINGNAFCFTNNYLFHLLLGEIANNDGHCLAVTFLHERSNWNHITPHRCCPLYSSLLCKSGQRQTTSSPRSVIAPVAGKLVVGTNSRLWVTKTKSCGLMSPRSWQMSPSVKLGGRSVMTGAWLGHGGAGILHQPCSDTKRQPVSGDIRQTSFLSSTVRILWSAE